MYKVSPDIMRISIAMKWLELSVQVDAGSVEEAASLLSQYGQGGAIIEEKASPAPGEPPFTVRAYLPADRSLPQKRQRLAEGLKGIPLQERLTDEQDWTQAWKSHFVPHKIGERIVIKPSWHNYSPTPAEIVLELDPGLAFGTGLHSTTRLCLLRLERHLQAETFLLDLGTGSGILAIAAARLGDARVLALDIDPVAVRVARQNVRVNGVGKAVKVDLGTLTPAIAASLKGCFDLAVANITSPAIAGLAGALALVLKPGGCLIASGIAAPGLDEVLISLTLAGLTVEAIDREGEWQAVVATRNSHA